MKRRWYERIWFIGNRLFVRRIKKDIIKQLKREEWITHYDVSDTPSRIVEIPVRVTLKVKGEG